MNTKYTPEELAKIEAETDAAFKVYVQKLAANVCPFCDKPIEHRRQVGRCMYAEPCNHRLYQGRA